MRKKSDAPILPDAFGIGTFSRLAGYSPIWLRTLEARGVLGPVLRIDGRRQYTPENLQRLSDYQSKGRRK